MNNKGDILLGFDQEGDLDISFENGQPVMTQYFDNVVYLYVFGEDNYQNTLVDRDSQKLQSEFPALIKRGTITNSLIAEGISAIKKALSVLIKEKIAKSITVTGGTLSLYSVYWKVEIEKLNDETTSYSIIWDQEQTKFQRIF